MTAKLAVAPQILLHALFHGARQDVEIRGASFDPVRQVVLLEIDGDGIPDADEITAFIELSVDFKAR